METSAVIGFGRQLATLPILLTLLIVAGLLLRIRMRRAGTTLVAVAAAAFYLAMTPYVGTGLLRWLEKQPAITTATDSPPGTIVILSAGIEADATGQLDVGPLTLQRLRHGARLHRETGLPVIVSGGIASPAPRTLASLMAETLRRDFAIDDIALEDRSRTTAENASLTALLLAKRNIKSVYLVTHGWHMPRAREAFEAVGIGVQPAPTAFLRPPGKGSIFSDFLPSARGLRNSDYAAHELLGLVWYRLAEY